MSLAGTVARHRRVRDAGVRLVRASARAAPAGPPPRVFVTSIPKAGTHLLTALLRALPRMRMAGLHLNPVDFRLDRTDDAPGRYHSGERPELDWERLRALLGRVKHGQFVTAHWPPQPGLRVLLDELGYRSIFLFRDPRDVVVSSAFFVMARPSHPLHGRYARLGSDGDRLLASIRGLQPTLEVRGFPGIPSQYARFRPWLIAEGALSCRFEDLVGERGGGSERAQREAVEAVARHLARPLAPDRRDRVAARAWSPGSVTFRKGAIGEWRRHFDERHLEAFRAEGAQVVRAYGYESDDSWLGRPEPPPAAESAPAPVPRPPTG